MTTRAVVGTGLSYDYRHGTQVLDQVDVSWPDGVVALLGPNGAGKTTLLGC